MKVIIAGSRNATDFHAIRDIIDWHFHNKIDITEVVCGMARGVDTFGKMWAITLGITVKEFPADWKKYGKAAGPIRNKQMADYADPAIVIYNPDISRGSKNMIETMKRFPNTTLRCCRWFSFTWSFFFTA